MSMPYQSKCMFREIYETRKLKSPGCQKMFEQHMRGRNSLFCPVCRPVVRREKARGNFGREHDRNPLNLPKGLPMECVLYNSGDIQRMSPAQLGKLGKLGQDFLVLR